MKKYHYLFLILLHLIIIGGCSSNIQNKEPHQTPQNSQPSVQSTPYPKNDVSIPKNDSQDLNNINAGESDKVKGWKVLKYKGNIYTTNDWFSFSNVNYPKTPFCIYYPGDWTHETGDSVFYNKSGRKVAEIGAITLLKDGQKILDNYDTQSHLDNGIQLISKKEISLAGLKGIKTVERVELDDPGDFDHWSVHSYYLKDKQKVFHMSFYELQLDSGEEDLFDRIVDTFRFDNE